MFFAYIFIFKALNILLLFFAKLAFIAYVSKTTFLHILIAVFTFPFF